MALSLSPKSCMFQTDLICTFYNILLQELSLWQLLILILFLAAAFILAGLIINYVCIYTSILEYGILEIIKTGF